LTSRAKFLTRSEISLDTGFQNFGTGAESGSEKATPATSERELSWRNSHNGQHGRAGND